MIWVLEESEDSEHHGPKGRNSGRGCGRGATRVVSDPGRRSAYMSKCVFSAYSSKTDTQLCGHTRRPDTKSGVCVKRVLKNMLHDLNEFLKHPECFKFFEPVVF